MAEISKGITVCFVCYGNICRSPMAAALVRDIIQKDPIISQRNIEICSAGTGAIGGCEAQPNAQKVMKEYGLTLEHHTASPLSKHIVEKADLIVAMDTDVEKEIISLCPESSQKICTLDIGDPIGQPVEVYRQRAQEIRDSCVSRVLPLVTSLS